jgi:ATP-dependent exoDNAse (exonuclease V) alpha subunit
MAIFHLNAKIISRGNGQSAIAAAAYRSGERLRDEQADQQKFYRSRAERIQFTEIMAPKGAPEWALDRGQLWNHAERAEKRVDSRLAREFEISLPHELTEQQREWLVKDFAREQFVRRGYVVDIAIHAPDKDSDQRNHHAHLMVTMRPLSATGPEGFAPKLDRSLNTKEHLDLLRSEWAHLANRHLERHGHDERIDHRSYKERGIDREPTVHLGYAANEMAARGAQSDRMDAFREVLERNELRGNVGTLEAELRVLERERERGREDWRKHSSRDPHAHEWAERAGMVAQQHAANKWVKDAERDQDGMSASGARKEWSQKKSPRKEGRDADERSDRDDERDR